jgi:hypothetical protein
MLLTMDPKDAERKQDEKTAFFQQWRKKWHHI